GETMRPTAFTLVIGVCIVAGAATAELAIVDTIPGDFTDIAATGTPLSLDDEGTVQVACDFDPTATLFAGDGSGACWVSNNGALGFLADGASGAFYQNGEIPNLGLFSLHQSAQALAVYWDDLDSDTGEIYVETVGDPGERVLIVQWQDRPHYAGDDVLDGDEATFQVKIFESGAPAHAQFIYVDVDFQDPALDWGASATIGYQAGGHQNDVQWSFDTVGAIHAGQVLSLIDALDCPEDLDGDGFVGQSDLGVLLASYGQDAGGDIDGDGDTDQADLGALLARFNEPC
ncbi:MAG: hypothetical protein ACF8NJ_07505, partial [Phycisphaerales bacterium JB038]